MSQPTSPTLDDAQLLRQFLTTREAACPRCGYSLRALTSDRCPECGDTLTLSLGGDSLPMGAYLAAVVAAALGLGGSSLSVTLLMVDDGVVQTASEVLTLVEAWLGLTPTPRWFIFREAKLSLMLMVEAVLTGGSLAWLLLRRAAYLKFAPKVRIVIAGALWAMILLFAVAAVLLLR